MALGNLNLRVPLRFRSFPYCNFGYHLLISVSLFEVAEFAAMQVKIRRGDEKRARVVVVFFPASGIYLHSDCTAFSSGGEYFSTYEGKRYARNQRAAKMYDNTCMCESSKAISLVSPAVCTSFRFRLHTPFTFLIRFRSLHFRAQLLYPLPGFRGGVGVDVTQRTKRTQKRGKRRHVFGEDGAQRCTHIYPCNFSIASQSDSCGAPSKNKNLTIAGAPEYKCFSVFTVLIE